MQYTRKKSWKREYRTEYNAWVEMRRRCYTKTCRSYPRYGGRGIKVCKRWGKFVNFLNDMGLRPKGEYSLERRNIDQDYSPENCCWIPHVEQAKNRSNNHKVTYRGRTLILADWERELGFSKLVLVKRLWRGWDIERAFTTPQRKPKTR